MEAARPRFELDTLLRPHGKEFLSSLSRFYPIANDGDSPADAEQQFSFWLEARAETVRSSAFRRF
jgi:hypothetical protein